MKDEIVILVKKAVGKKGTGGYRAAIYKSGWGAKPTDAWGKTPKEALVYLADKLDIK